MAKEFQYKKLDDKDHSRFQYREVDELGRPIEKQDRKTQGDFHDAEITGRADFAKLPPQIRQMILEGLITYVPSVRTAAADLAGLSPRVRANLDAAMRFAHEHGLPDKVSETPDKEIFVKHSKDKLYGPHNPPSKYLDQEKIKPLPLHRPRDLEEGDTPPVDSVKKDFRFLGALSGFREYFLNRSPPYLFKDKIKLDDKPEDKKKMVKVSKSREEQTSFGSTRDMTPEQARYARSKLDRLMTPVVSEGILKDIDEEGFSGVRAIQTNQRRRLNQPDSLPFETSVEARRYVERVSEYVELIGYENLSDSQLVGYANDLYKTLDKELAKRK